MDEGERSFSEIYQVNGLLFKDFLQFACKVEQACFHTLFAQNGYIEVAQL